MGDFNTRNTTELCYQTLIASSDTNFNFFDPPFMDGALTYPADWDSNPNLFKPYLTTSTRANATDNCDNGGGAKNWYDHIFISHWLKQNSNYIQYIPNSYRTIGNDGNRLNISVNGAPANTSVPSNVANAIYGLSDKYPVMVDLAVTYNTTGVSPIDPQISTAVQELSHLYGSINFINPIQDKLVMQFSNVLLHQPVKICCYNMFGQLIFNDDIIITDETLSLPFLFPSGIYLIKIMKNGEVIGNNKLIKY